MMPSRKVTMQIMFAVFVSVMLLSSCGGGGGGNTDPSPTSHTVNISWAANREASVNSNGGGYIVAINGQSPINVPYVSGTSTTPTTTTFTLMSGNYSGTVTAYSALNSPGGTTGSTSAPSTFSFSVPY